MAKVILIHSGNSATGGVANATLFYCAALQAAGTPAEIWTASEGLAARSRQMQLPVFYHPFLKSAGLALIHPSIVLRALKARKHAKAVVHNGEKLWLFGRVWLSGVEESVVFHSSKINQRALFRRWLVFSERHKQDLMSFAGKRRLKPNIQLIRNGPLPVAAGGASRARDRAGQVKTIGYLGVFGYRKGIDVLIEAYAQLLREGHDLKLILAGDGGAAESFRALARELDVYNRIEWTGWIANTHEFFQEIDLFCLPTREEPFGIVITEAMQAGVAVISTDTDGPSEIVVPGETGWLIPPDNVQALCGAIEEAIANPAQTARYGAAGASRFQERYALDAAGRAFVEALQRTG